MRLLSPAKSSAGQHRGIPPCIKGDLATMTDMLVHTVFFWLKPNIDRAAFQADVATLGDIPGVQFCYVGTPAATPDRPVIDASYDVGLTVILPDLATHDIYQEHPLHLAFLAKRKNDWMRVQVFDAD